ncbi:uncharacterized protein HMPREF1541_06637 [Cyphellophora europaea CBS 101466]|uniref:N-alpha-acetyltransferase 40 n=1 Tax=Cyphellophora europaea (strain CBS 101466) TaxID=1220924 RepID=W2RQK4_CYPE1|nr:uncharacterized protein HMPREF1541_06637 [Cyphellophora europaea CBS 101466]ETN38600.1 hypothetical protein HMPREF1541_06637 [Cyphellophora europaea CBS 101466]
MAQKLVESTNRLNAQQLFARYYPENDLQDLETATSLTGSQNVLVQRADAQSLTAAQLNACLDLVEQTSAEDYRNSETGWSRTKKRREMRLPDLRYILLFDRSQRDKDHQSPLIGFISFMITYEDGYEVIYIYEIHFDPSSQGKGLGRRLMSVVETIGANIGVEKAMLTVFKSNERATSWYDRLGYSTDEFSPPARQLRGGVMKEPTYVILSKILKDPTG